MGDLRVVLPGPAPEQRRIVAEVVIPSNRDLVLHLVDHVGIGVVGIGRLVGSRPGHLVPDCQGNGVDSAGGNDVVGKCDPLAVDDVEGVVDGNQALLPVALPEIPRQLGGRRNVHEPGQVRFVHEALVAGVEEGLVLDDGPAHGAAEGMAAYRELAQSGPVGEKAVGVELFVAQILPGKAMKLVAAAVAGHAHHGAADAAVFSREGVADDLELLDRLRRRIHRGPLIIESLSAGSIQHDLAGVRPQAVDGGKTARISNESGVGRIANADRTGGELRQQDQVPIGDGQLGDLGLVQRGADVSRVRVQRRGLSHDGHLLGDLAGTQEKIETRHLSRVQADLRHVGLEAGQLRPGLVDSGDELVHQVVPGVVADRGSGDIGFRVGDRDLDAWDHRSRLVDHPPYDLPIGGQLTVRVGQGEAKDECQR